MVQKVIPVYSGSTLKPLTVLHTQKPQVLDFSMVNKNNNFGLINYAFFCDFWCPGKLFYKTAHKSFMMAHFETKIHEKAIESHKINVVKGQMSAMHWECEVIGQGVTQKSYFKVIFRILFFWLHSVSFGTIVSYMVGKLGNKII